MAGTSKPPFSFSNNHIYYIANSVIIFVCDTYQ